MTRLIAALGAAALLLPTVAAANPFVQPDAMVKADDLDLGTPDGRARLNSRIETAAEDVCGRNMDRIHLSVAAKARDCKVAVIDELEARQRAARGDVLPAG